MTVEALCEGGDFVDQALPAPSLFLTPDVRLVVVLVLGLGLLFPYPVRSTPLLG